MIKEQFQGLTISYLGNNHSHRIFRATIANAKVFAYIIACNNSKVLHEFLSEANKMKQQSQNGLFAIGLIGGRSTTTEVQLAIHITGTEIHLVNSELGGFSSQSLALIYREVYRAFVNYLMQLFKEITKSIQKKYNSNLSYGGFYKLQKEFDKLQLPVISIDECLSQELNKSLEERLILLNAIRNLIEHNDSVVDEKFKENLNKELEQNKFEYSIGEKIIITLTELGDALSAVEWIADNLNRRAVAKFDI